MFSLAQLEWNAVFTAFNTNKKQNKKTKYKERQQIWQLNTSHLSWHPHGLQGASRVNGEGTNEFIQHDNTLTQTTKQKEEK